MILNILDKNFMDEDYKQKNLNEQNINKSLYYDSVTHIFGTIGKDTHTINFLGFKCFSGKIGYIGKPKGESFLFGEFGKRFYNLRLEINKEEGITLFEPGFINNESIKYFKQNFSENIKNISNIDLNKNIYEESNLKNLDNDLLNYIITTNFEEDKYLFEEEKSEIKIYDYKEVITLSNRTWIKNEEKKRKEQGELISKISLVVKNTKSEGKSSNYMNINLENEKKELYSYNPNPFLKEINLQNIKLKNPFFKTNNEKPEKIDLKLHFHRVITQHQQKVEESNIKNNKFVRDSKLIDILKSFNKNMADLSNNIHNESIKEIFHKDNNNINFSLIPFYILDEIIPKDVDERDKKKIFKKEDNEKKLTLNGVQIETSSSSEYSIKTNDKNNVKSEQSDAAYYWGKIKSELPIKKKIKDGDIKEKWKYLKYVVFKLSKIIKIMIKLFDNQNNEEKFKQIKLSDKIKYYKILSDKENENIINFLTQSIKDENNDENKNIKDNDEKLDISTLKNLKDIEDNIKKLSDEKKDASKEHILEQIKYFKNIYIENLEKIKLNENERIQDIYKEYEDCRAFESERNNKAFQIIQNMNNIVDDKANNEQPLLIENINNTVYLDNSDNYVVDEQNKEIKKHFYLRQETINTDKDPEFKPDINSLCPYEKEKSDWFRPLPFKVLSSDIQNWKNIGWTKIKGIEIFSQNSNPTLDNIRQGEYIGDCYFLSALGALCDRKDYLKKLIKRIKKNEESIGYEVKLNLNGKWKYVLVDKYFPYLIANNMFCFGSSFKNELWVSLFEKAWAKVSGCYARIGCGGKCGDGFDVLTSAISEYYLIVENDDKKKDELWNKLKDAKDKKNNYVIGAGTRGFGFFERILGLGLGLISSHAYTIINVYEKIYNDKLIKLVKLRNPWGEKEFNGDWSDNSKKWNKELKLMFEFGEVKDDGIFYMSYNDFIYYFKSVEILKIRENYEIIDSCKIRKNEAYKMQIIELKIPKIDNKKTVKVFINLYQKNPRIRKKNDEYYPEPAKAFLILAKKESIDKYTFIKSKTDIKNHIAIEADLDVNSTYIIFCDVNYRFIYKELYGYNITFYCDKSYKDIIKPKNITNDVNEQPSSKTLTKVLQNYFNDEKNKKNFEKIEIKDGIFWPAKLKFCVYRLNHFNEDFPFVILYIEDKDKEDKNKYFRLDLNFNNLKYKEACIYNDSEASEFDISVCKKINAQNNIMLIMGYTLTDIYSYNYYYEKKESMSFIFELNNPEKMNGYNLYRLVAEKDRGFIIIIENTEKNKDLKIDLEIGELYIINPEYNNRYNNNDKENSFIEEIIIKGGEKKVFNLRLKPNYVQPKFFVHRK